MTIATQIALTATPLAFYFYALSLFHGGKRPRMVGGPVDFGLLAFGLGGLVAFGPFGRAVLGRLVGDPAGLPAWSIWVSLIVLWSLVLAASASLRVTIYHISPEELDQAVREALGTLEGQFSPTLTGFEDPARKAGVTVKPSRFLRSGTVEAYGHSPNVLIRELKPKLRATLDRFPQRSIGVSIAMFGLSCATIFMPITIFLLANPRTKEALRSWMQSLRWW